MKTSSKALPVVLGSALLIMVAFHVLDRPVVSAKEKSEPVEITNIPLPVTGTVSATITGIQNVHVNNSTASPVPVQVTGLPTVQIGGSSTIQLAQSPAKIFRGQISYDGTTHTGMTNVTSDVLVIDLVSSVVASPNPVAHAALILYVLNTGEPQDPQYFVPGTFEPSSGETEVHALTKIYVKPGETLQMNNVSVAFLSGHYEPFM
jgi:hypothetical protein